MQLPFFFEEKIPTSDDRFVLSEESSKHTTQVLRMQKGELLCITNGKGETLAVSIIFPDKKKTEVEIIKRISNPAPGNKVSIAISLIKNSSRFEWFLEKATEIGVSEIIPFISERTEKQHFRFERMKSILISAMLQSQQAWLPEIHEPVNFKELVRDCSKQNKYIAHCIEDEKVKLKPDSIPNGDTILLIGPEGDFTKDEIESAIEKNFIPVSLGETRLRTETAGLVAAVLLLNK